MNARAERTVPAVRTRNKETIVDFSPERLRAPFALRCGALIIDYMILLAVPVLSILFSRYMGNDGTKLLNGTINNNGWLIAALLALTNFIILPMLGGRTIGKMLTGLRIVRKDGYPASFSAIVLRHTLGYALTALSLGLGFIISALNRNGRALHDYLAGTTVISGNRRVLKKD